MGLDNLVGDDSETNNESSSTQTRSGSAKKYVAITREEFEEFLENDIPYHWRTVNMDAGELVYETDEFMFEDDNVVLRIFSTIDKNTNVARGKGDDAIRQVIWNKKANAPMGGRKKTLRIQTWRKNLGKKIRSIADEYSEYVTRCPQCKSGWLVRRSSDYGPFYGCSNWDEEGGCDYTESIEE